MLDTHKLLMLRAIAAEGSIAAAARQLGYTRSAVSQQVSALERAAGTPLLIRSGNRVSLTPVGRTLVEHTERILVELRAAEAVLGWDGSGVAGLLRIGVPFREGPRIMSSALTDARRRHPQLEIRLTSIKDETGADEVRRGALDMVIVSRFGSASPPNGPGLREWVLGQDALRLCVPAEHRLAATEHCALADLRDDPWVVSPASTLGRLTLTLCVAAGFQPTIAATVDDVATALGLVGIGWGVTVAPELTPTSPESAIRRIELDGVTTSRFSVLIVRDGEERSPRIAAVVAAVLKTHDAMTRRLHAAGRPG